jgi:L-aminopeptidase/D-esterase-like protein
MSATLGVEGLFVGHFTDRDAGTGCTVVLAPKGVTASVDIRGGAPGTLETALLNPYASVREIHGVVLTGGSAPGLGAAAGVTRYLRERGLGYRTANARVPLVTAAVIYDLGVGSASGCPSPDDAYQAALEASGTVDEGSLGVGTGATVGKILGGDGMMKSGVALATVTAGEDVTVTALTVVNALGDVLDERGEILAGARRYGGFVNSQQLLMQMTTAPSFNAMECTTLSVVMTDARLDKLQCGIVARMSHDGFARAICPVHTPVDGDCIFVLSAGKKLSNVFQIGAAASEAVALSIRRAVRLAGGREGIPSVKTLQGDSWIGA